MAICEQIETGACRNCNILSILAQKAKTKEEVDPVADQISAEYCPSGTKGIDGQARAKIYNHRPSSAIKPKSSIW